MKALRGMVAGWVLLCCGSPSCRAGAAGEEAFDYFRNSWNVIGLRDYRDGARVTPDNRVLLGGGDRLEILLGPAARPLDAAEVKRLLDGWLPILLIPAVDGEVHYELMLWAAPLPDTADWRAAFDGPVAGEDFAVWVACRAANRGDARVEAALKVRRSGAAGTAEVAVAEPLEPGSSWRAAVRTGFAAPRALETVEWPVAEEWLARTRGYWQRLIDAGARIDVPLRKAGDALRAAHVCQLIASDGGELHGGEGFYDEFYIRDAGYQIMELEEAGLWDAAAKAVAFYLTRQRADGRFETQSDQFDANGQALWVLWQYYCMTRDRAWLEGAYPQMQRAVEWIKGARRQARGDPRFAGLLPAAPADGEFLWDGKHQIVGYDLWNLRGVLCAAAAAEALGRREEGAAWREEAAAYRAAIDAAWRATGAAHFPPSWDGAGTHWGNTETLWPTALFAGDDARVLATIRHAREEHGGGYVEGTIRWLGQPDAIHPYMGAYTAMASLIAGQHDAFVADFYWYLLHSTAAHAFPEGVYFKERTAWSDTIPHVTGASNYALMLRHMLVHEEGDELHLLAGVPDEWLAAGRRIAVERLPTHFGEMRLVVEGAERGVEIALEAPRREAPRRIVLFLPPSRPLLTSTDGIGVVTRPDQARGWDFDRLVAEYEAGAPPRVPVAAGPVLEHAPAPDGPLTVRLPSEAEWEYACRAGT